MTPPADLKPAVMRAIRIEKSAARARGVAQGALLRPGRPFGLRLALAFVSGCAAGILVWTLATGTRGPLGSLPTSGTMMSPSSPSAPALDRAQLRTTGASATLEARPVAPGIEVAVDARADGEAELVIEHDTGLEPEALDMTPSRPRMARFAPGSVTLEFSGGLRCAIRLRGPHADGQPLRVTLRSRGEAATGTLAGRPAGGAR